MPPRSARPAGMPAADDAERGAHGPDAHGRQEARERELVRVRATPAAVRLLVSMVARALERAGWPREARGDVMLAVDEAVQNAVEHGSLPAAPVELEMALDDEAARLAVRDLGRPGASPPTADPRPPEPASVRGRGRLIISTLADEAEWRPNGHGTEVRLRFGRSGRGDVRSPS